MVEPLTAKAKMRATIAHFIVAIVVVVVVEVVNPLDPDPRKECSLAFELTRDPQS